MSKMMRRRIVLTPDQFERMKKAADGRPLERFMGLLALAGYGEWLKTHPASKADKEAEDGQ